MGDYDTCELKVFHLPESNRPHEPWVWVIWFTSGPATHMVCANGADYARSTSRRGAIRAGRRWYRKWLSPDVHVEENIKADVR